MYTWTNQLTKNPSAFELHPHYWFVLVSSQSYRAVGWLYWEGCLSRLSENTFDHFFSCLKTVWMVFKWPGEVFPMANQDMQTEESSPPSSSSNDSETNGLCSSASFQESGLSDQVQTQGHCPGCRAAAGSSLSRSSTSREAGVFLDKVSRERCGSPVLGQVGMSQPSFLLATRKGLLEGAPAQILRVKVRMRIWRRMWVDWTKQVLSEFPMKEWEN